MSRPNNNTVKVGVFRQRYEHLYRRVQNCHACCYADEVRTWKRVTQALLDEVSALKCGRASPEDLEAHRRAVAVITERLAAADQRIEAYEMKKAPKAAVQEPTRPALRLIQGYHA